MVYSQVHKDAVMTTVVSTYTWSTQANCTLDPVFALKKLKDFENESQQSSRTTLDAHVWTFSILSTPFVV